MAPKKKPQQKPKSSSSKPKPQAASTSGPKVRLTTETENRLRRLVLNSGHSSAAQTPANDHLSRDQKAKKLHTVYEKLSCEGFTDESIEKALSALKDSATFQSALDWLCLNLPGNELPLKFSTGTSQHTTEGNAIGVILPAQRDWSPVDSATRIQEDASEFTVRIKGHANNDTLDSCQSSQADWIRQYMEQQEEDEYDSWEDGLVEKEVPEQKVSIEVLIKDYHNARLEAMNAKKRGDKQAQQQAGQTISKLKQEMMALGVSDDMLTFEHETSSFGMSDDASGSIPSEHPDAPPYGDQVNKSSVSQSFESEDCTSEDLLPEQAFEAVPVQSLQKESENEDVELGGFFLEDDSLVEVLPSDIGKLQKEKKRCFNEKSLELLEGIWKKGDPKKIPKAVLQQLCQKSGWDAPKYKKVSERTENSSYAVSILRKASGRGKSRKSGGLVTLQLPSEDETSLSAEDAQNKVATFSLCRLFPDIPVHLLITEPYATLAKEWEEGESTERGNHEEHRRAGFVNSLLTSNESKSVDPIEGKILKSNTNENIEFTAAPNLNAKKFNHLKEAEGSYLRQELENKRMIQRYKQMLESRTALPIAEMKDDILRLLKENDVLVVCGETGSGKTTQVPQYILDDMIEAGNGGHCNIICTQPRRIAVC